MSACPEQQAARSKTVALFKKQKDQSVFDGEAQLKLPDGFSNRRCRRQMTQ